MSKSLSDFILQHERNVDKNTHGYPKSFISELLELTINLNKEKKKWQRLAQDRKSVLDKIESMININRVLNNLNDGEKDGLE